MKAVVSAVCLHHVRLLLLCALLVAGIDAYAPTDPLPSWNDGPAKKAIIAFVPGDHR